MRSLPDWFGIEEAIVEYRQAVGDMETWVADRADEILGFLTLHEHNDSSAEIHVMAVRPGSHRQGVGRALVDHAEALLAKRSIEFFQVKTLGPSRPDEHYAQTRGFYEALGFRPLEENALWGERNPCLIMIKHLPCASA